MDADGWGVPSDEGSSTDAPAEARPGAGQDTDLGAIPPPPPEFTTVDGGLALPPAAPAGYGLIDSPEAPAPVFYGPPLARVLVESGRVSPPRTWRSPCQAHQQTGESLARYLYNQQAGVRGRPGRGRWPRKLGSSSSISTQSPIEPRRRRPDPRGGGPSPHGAADRASTTGCRSWPWPTPPTCSPWTTCGPIMGRNFTPVVATRSQIASHLRFVHDARRRRGRRRRGRGPGPGLRGSGFELESLHGGGRGRSDRPLCQPAHPPGPQRAGIGHPHRADPKAPPDPFPDRRRDARRHLGIVVDRTMPWSAASRCWARWTSPSTGSPKRAGSRCR